MPRGSAPGEHRGGRKAGTPNKKTVLLRAAAAKAAAIVDDAKAKARLIAASKTGTGTQLIGRSTSRQVLEKFRDTLAGMAAYYQPSPGGDNKNANLAAFLDCSDLAIKCAKELYDREEPKLRAVLVAAAPAIARPEPPSNVTTLKQRDAVGAGRLYREMLLAKRPA